MANLPLVFSQKICKTCHLKFRPAGSGREVECQVCKTERKAAKLAARPPRKRRDDLPRRECKECHKRFRPYHTLEEFCSDEHRDTYWQRYRLARSREAREAAAAPVVVAHPEPAVAPAGFVRHVPEDGSLVLGRQVGGAEFFRLKRLYELREAGEFEGHVV